MSKSKEYGAQLYEAAVLMVGAIGISFASRKLTKDTPRSDNAQWRCKTSACIRIKCHCTLPDNPFKSS